MNYLQNTISIIALALVLSPAALAAQELIHTVAKGETVYSISRTYKVSPGELMRANGITDPSKLQAGQRLVIPGPAAANTLIFAEYRVIKGDTLTGIARTHGISLQKLLDINNFSARHIIKIGDIVKVPGRVTPGTVQSAPAQAASNTAQSADTLRWPVTPRNISYMTGQLGVVVQGEPFEPVKSLIQGKVVSAGPWRKFGKVAIVEVSGGYYYMYGGCESLSVKVGDSIGPGTELGKLGINVVSEKPQLFFMVFRNNTPIDPAKAPRAGSNVKT